MWIECTNPSTKSIYDREIMGGDGEPLVFKDGKADVRAEIGEALVKKYKKIHAVGEKKAAKSKSKSKSRSRTKESEAPAPVAELEAEPEPEPSEEA